MNVQLIKYTTFRDSFMRFLRKFLIMVSMNSENMSNRTKIIVRTLVGLFLALGIAQNSLAGRIVYWDSAAGKIKAIEHHQPIVTPSTLILFWEIDSAMQPPFRYRLEKLHPQWSNWDRQPSAVFESVQSGDFRFQIEDVNGKIKEFVLQIRLKSSLKPTLTLLAALLLLIAAPLAYFFGRNTKAKTPAPETPESDAGKSTALPQMREQSKTHKYGKVTVLFADIQGFTKIVEHMNPEELIDELDKYFIYFDELVERFQIEKIKTIGDAYMCAGGIPEKNRTNPIDVMVAAMAMQAYVKAHHHNSSSDDYSFWELRIGVHTGSVISGMIGHKKRYFDIWGDTVNIASRMESSGIAGEINITGVTYQMVKDFFVCEYRGKMPIKYKGETDMYFLKHIHPHLSVDSEGKVPNKLFHTRLQLIRLDDLIDYLVDHYPDEYLTPFSGWLDRYLLQIEMVSRMERLTEEELLLTKTAALLLFRQSFTRQANVEIEKQLALILERYHYHPEQCATIQLIFNRFQTGERPGSLSEKIISDAHHCYLLVKNMNEILHALYQDYQILEPKVSWEEWIQYHKRNLRQHTFHTQSALQLSEISTDSSLQLLQYLQKKPLQAG